MPPQEQIFRGAWQRGSVIVSEHLVASFQERVRNAVAARTL
jgi:hypothetical protein